MDGKILYEKEPDYMENAGNITTYLRETKKLNDLIPYYKKYTMQKNYTLIE